MEAVVVDAGSKLLKAGFAIPDQSPSMILPCLRERLFIQSFEVLLRIGMPWRICCTMFFTQVLGGKLAMKVKFCLRIHFPLQRTTKRLTLFIMIIGLSGSIVLAAVREQLVQLMFETFNVSGFYASEQAVLSLYAVGRISGCTVDIGHGKKDIAPVIEGAVQHIASRRLEVGGLDLTKLFAEELVKSNPEAKLNLSDVEKLKEQYALYADDDVHFKKIQQSCQEEHHTLPDGQVITIGKERYIVGEALFQPSIMNLDTHGIVEQLIHSISTVSTENHCQLLENTELCGGTASMTGFEDRFLLEANLCSSAIRPSLVKPPEYMPENLIAYSAWVGGAIVAKVVFPQNQHITKADYDENGPAVVRRNCF